MPSPRETAQNEAARQAVALAFGVAGMVLLILVQRKMGGGLFAAVEAEQDRVDPSGAQRRRMENHLRAARQWDRMSTILFRYGPSRAFGWAWAKAEQARTAYERERY